MTAPDPIPTDDAAAPVRRWPKILALLLLPTIVAVLLLAGLGRPAERLDTVPAAIVNLDKPVTVNGQLAPLGRQLAQAIAHPAAGQEDATYDWVVTNADDAEAGLDDGEYAAVVVIPRGFSRAATSLASEDPHQATITVRTSERSGLSNGVVTANLTAAAQQAFGADLTARYLRNLYVGVGKLRIGLGRMATGAQQLADGTEQLASGTGQLSDGLGQLAGGANQLATGTGALAGGAAQLSAGVSEAATGASQLATGNRKLADGIAGYADGVEQFADSLTDAGRFAASADAGMRDLLTALGGLEEAKKVCEEDPANCIAALQQAVAGLPDREELVALATAIGTTNGYLNGAQGQPGLVGGATDLAGGAGKLAQGSARAADGTEQLAAGVQQLAQGTGELAVGAEQLAGGAGQLSDGTTQAAVGADPLAAGAESLAQGTDQLADGLQQAAGEVPSYTRAQRAAMAQVAATPVVGEAVGEDGLTWLGAALLVTLVLWIGSILTWLVLKPVSARAYGSSQSTARLAWQAARPGLAVGAGQGLLVGAVVAASLDTTGAGRAAFVLVAVVAGVAFTAGLQGVIGLLGLLGGVVAIAWGAVALAAGLVSTAPAWFSAALSLLPLGPLVNGLRQLAAGVPGLPWGSIATLVVVGVAGFLATMAATRRRRLRAPAAA